MSFTDEEIAVLKRVAKSEAAGWEKFSPLRRLANRIHERLEQAIGPRPCPEDHLGPIEFYPHDVEWLERALAHETARSDRSEQYIDQVRNTEIKCSNCGVSFYLPLRPGKIEGGEGYKKAKIENEEWY